LISAPQDRIFIITVWWCGMWRRDMQSDCRFSLCTILPFRCWKKKLKI